MSFDPYLGQSFSQGTAQQGADRLESISSIEGNCVSHILSITNIFCSRSTISVTRCLLLQTLDAASGSCGKGPSACGVSTPPFASEFQLLAP